jgi:hypothetical protein
MNCRFSRLHCVGLRKRHWMLSVQSANSAETVTHWFTFSSVLLSDFWRSPTMTITFLPISLWETKLTFIWMASQTHTTAESGQLKTLWLFMRNHCTLRVSQFGLRYAQQMWLDPTSLRMKWAEQLRLQVTVTEQWSPHSWHLQWSAWRWVKNGGLWFQQDGATCHTARESVACLRQLFPGRLIYRYGDLPWPPRYPDLAAPDFFMGLP